MGGQTDVRTDSPCVLLDFVPLWGRSPACQKAYHKQTAQQGKGTDDHLLPLGNWLQVVTPCKIRKAKLPTSIYIK